MESDAGHLPPPLMGGVQLTVQEQIPDHVEIPGPPPPPPLPNNNRNPLPVGNLGNSAEIIFEESPPDSVLGGLGEELRGLGGDDVSLGGQTIGIKDLKSNFTAAMRKDRDVSSKPLRFLKRAARVSGLVLGITINLTAKVVAFAVAAAAAPVVMVGLSIVGLFQDEAYIWHNPREALVAIFAGGTAAGAVAGAAIGGFGNLLIKASLSMEYENGDDIGTRLKEDFTQAFKDNVSAAAIGSGIGTAASLVNPVLWRAAWVPDTDL